MGGGIGDRRWWWLLGAIVALGLVLRIAGAQGSLWLDEAWSAVQAHDAGTPLGVFLSINHDNNHHLNSLWMQAVGFGAPPLLVRGFAILTSTASIVIAGLIGRRRAASLGLMTALLFAVSPLLVTLGSEARGYAGMALALLVAILLLDRWLAGDTEQSPAIGLALAFFLGAFSQLTMFFGFCAVSGWIFFALWWREGLRAALVRSVRLFLPSIVALGLVVAIVLGAAAAHGGFHFGAYDRFNAVQMLHGIAEMIEFALGFPPAAIWWFALIPVLLVLAPGTLVSRMGLHRLAIFGFPATLALLHVGNVGHPRYYLLGGVVLLLLVAQLAWLGIVAKGWKRWLAAGAFTAVVTGSLVQDIDLANNRRGDPGAAVREMQRLAPQGTRVLLDRDNGSAMLEVAAAEHRYPLQITLDDCLPSRFLLVDRSRNERHLPRLERCGRRFVPILEGRARGLSGTHWTLYARQP